MSSVRLRVLLAAATLVAALSGPVPVALAAQGLALTTPYPAVTTSPDSRVSFDLSVDANESGRIDLEVTGVPASWSASLHGGGLVVRAVQLNGSDATEVRLDLDVPADATGTTRITVVASDAESRVELPLDVSVEAEAEGDITVDADFPALRGAAGTTFTFNLTVDNNRSEDLTYTATGQGPLGWTVEVTPTGQSQAVSATVPAGTEAGLTVTVEPPADAAASTYEIAVVATVGQDQYEIPLQVEITGSYELELSTPTLNLTARGPSGATTEQVFVITNLGSAPVTGVTLAATPPTGWQIAFEPETIESVAPGQPAQVTARITPRGDSIAGDYSITFRANGEEADAEADLRFTVEASILGGLLGLALIAAAVGGLFYVFRRYGRR